MNLTPRIRYILSPLTSKITTDTISFNVTSEIDYSEVKEGWEWKHADILINGRSLFDRLKEHELREAKLTNTDFKLAGKYIGIDPADIKKRHFKNGSVISLWQCADCQSGLCSSHLFCKYKENMLFVWLYDFRQIPFNRHDTIHPEAREKTKWSYNDFGPFKFSKNEFYKAIDALK